MKSMFLSSVVLLSAVVAAEPVEHRWMHVITTDSVAANSVHPVIKANISDQCVRNALGHEWHKKLGEFKATLVFDLTEPFQEKPGEPKPRVAVNENNPVPTNIRISSPSEEEGLHPCYTEALSGYVFQAKDMGRINLNYLFSTSITLKKEAVAD